MCHAAQSAHGPRQRDWGACSALECTDACRDCRGRFNDSALTALGSLLSALCALLSALCCVLCARLSPLCALPSRSQELSFTLSPAEIEAMVEVAAGSVSPVQLPGASGEERQLQVSCIPRAKTGAWPRCTFPCPVWSLALACLVLQCCPPLWCRYLKLFGAGRDHTRRPWRDAGQVGRGG